MIEVVPLALACGHLADGVLRFRVDGPGGPLIECPAGCGYQRWVADPGPRVTPSPPLKLAALEEERPEWL